jgi:hypothetical protein
MDYYNYLQENDAFQQIKDSAEQQRSAFEDVKQRYLETGDFTLLPAFDLLSKGVRGISKVAGVISDVGEKASGAIEKVSGAVEKVSGTVQNVETSVNENLNNISGRLSDRLRTNAFDADPEEGLASNEMNVSSFERVQQIFRGGNLAEQAGEQAEGVVSRVSGLAEQAETTVSGLASRVSGAVSGLADQAETTVSGLASRAMGAVEEGVSQLGEKSIGEIASKVGSTVAEGVGEAVGEGIGALASEAVPIIGELTAVGLGIYDLFKGFQKTPAIQAEAIPSFISGL